MDDASTDPRIGKVLQDRYRIVGEIDEGAVGSVYKAERLKLGRIVAVKFLHASMSTDKAFRRRFEREALAMSRLGHPHCVSVLDFGFDVGPYIVMDYVTGESLRDLLDRGRVAVGRSLHIVRQVLAGLAHAHRQGIVHRDIKPANIMLTEATGTGDHARILDFGLATLRDSGLSGDVSEAWLIVGTPAYMSPEQSLGNKVDARSDIYSVGVTLFHLLTGEKPYDAEEAFETLRMHREDKLPKLEDYAAGVEFPSGLQKIISKAMAKDADARYQTAQEFAEAIEAIAASSGIPDPLAYDTTQSVQAVPPRRSRVPYLVAALILIAGAAGASVWYQQRANERQQTVEAAAAGPPEQRQPGTTAVVDPADASVAEAMVAPPFDAGAEEVHDAGGTDGMPEVLNLPPDELDDPIAAIEDTGEEPTEPGEVDELPLPTPTREVNSVDDAKALIKEGKRAEAIAGLRRLRRKSPKSAYVPYLLGGLYFEKKFWTDGMKMYAVAIDNNRNYRKRSTLNKNVIRALASEKTKSRAITLYLRKIGRSGLPFLRKAAKSDRNSKVRRRAKYLIKKLSKKKKKKKKKRRRKR